MNAWKQATGNFEESQETYKNQKSRREAIRGPRKAMRANRMICKVNDRWKGRQQRETCNSGKNKRKNMILLKR